MAQRNWCQAKGECQIVSGVEFCGHYAAFWSTAYTDEYLEDVKGCLTFLAGTDVEIERSLTFDLMETTERKEFARHFKSMLNDVGNRNW